MNNDFGLKSIQDNKELPELGQYDWLLLHLGRVRMSFGSSCSHRLRTRRRTREITNQPQSTIRIRGNISKPFVSRVGSASPCDGKTPACGFLLLRDRFFQILVAAAAQFFVFLS